MPATARRLRSAAAVLAVLAVAGCGNGSVVDQSVDNSLGFQQGSGGAVVYKLGHREPVGDVSGTALNGQRLSLASLRGKVVVVNFWESNCGPCRAEAPSFNQVAKDDAAKGVAFLGIDVRDNKSSAVAFDTEHHVAYPSLFDPAGVLGLQFPHNAPSATPTTIVVDRAGDIAAKVSGALEYTQLRALVNDVRSEKT